MSESTPTSTNGLHRDELVQWMLSPDRSEDSIVELIHGLNLRLSREANPIFRVNFMVRTLHPQLEFMVFTWQPVETQRLRSENTQTLVSRTLHDLGEYTMEEYLVGHGHVKEEMFRSSPFHFITSGTPEIRCSLVPVPDPPAFPILTELIDAGGTDYFALSLHLRAPYAGAMSFSTRAPGGFTDGSLERFRQLQGVISLFLAPVLTQQAASVVLSAYMGVDPARRVMEGSVRLGEIGELDAVIGFVDMRHYSRASQELDGRQLVELLDTFFTELHTLFSRTGGEILKFMGDGALFVFPISEGDLSEVCRRAADAVEALDCRLDVVNESREREGLRCIRYGLALHTGRVMYGNIGAPRRMDFTVVGPAVNLASRLEGLCGRLRLKVVVTEDFARHLPGRYHSLGLHRVRGVEGTVEVFGAAGASERDLGAHDLSPGVKEAEGP